MSATPFRRTDIRHPQLTGDGGTIYACAVGTAIIVRRTDIHQPQLTGDDGTVYACVTDEWRR